MAYDACENFIKEKSMDLNKDQEALFRKSMEEAKNQLHEIDDEMEKLVQMTREKLAKLQDSKKSLSQIYVSSAQLLGEEVEIEQEDNSGQEEGTEQSQEESFQAEDATQDQPS
jgi:ElaB/YqjD/DUF883 family membrane-anchored ribosome-binding protein